MILYYMSRYIVMPLRLYGILGTTAVNDRVHRAATLLAQQLAPEQGTVAGVRIKLNMQADGLWQRSVELIGQ